MFTDIYFILFIYLSLLLLCDATSSGEIKLVIGPAHALNPILTVFGMWGGPS